MLYFMWDYTTRASLWNSLPQWDKSLILKDEYFWLVLKLEISSTRWKLEWGSWRNRKQEHTWLQEQIGFTASFTMTHHHPRRAPPPCTTLYIYWQYYYSFQTHVWNWGKWSEVTYLYTILLGWSCSLYMVWNLVWMCNL
jgi:hypothetical protein